MTAKSVSEIRDRIRKTFNGVRPQSQFGYESAGPGVYNVWCRLCDATAHPTSLDGVEDWMSGHGACDVEPIECALCCATKADVGEGDCCSTFWAKFTAVR